MQVPERKLLAGNRLAAWKSKLAAFTLTALANANTLLQVLYDLPLFAKSLVFVPAGMP